MSCPSGGSIPDFSVVQFVAWSLHRPRYPSLSGLIILIIKAEKNVLGVIGLGPSSGILKNTFRKLDLFPSSGEGLGDNYCVESVRIN
jgi:hypothetical protein